MNRNNPEITIARKQKHALAGVKVLDFGWALIGSWTTKYLSDFGAQVVKVESAAVPDRLRGSSIDRGGAGFFSHINSSKYGITLNLKHPKAKELIDRFIRWADVVTENFSPGTLNRLGIGYAYMKTIKPEIIMASASIFGQTGPRSHEPGTDLTGTTFSGYLDLGGRPDSAPIMPGPNAPYGDFVTPFFNAMTIIAALDYRKKTGKGQYIDTSMVEVISQTHIPELLNWQANSYLEKRDGNRITYASPHGVFPCKDDDRWCAIAVFTDEEWKSFCKVIGNLPWTKDPKFATLQSRKENEDELEKLVADWTIIHSPQEVMTMLQAEGVPAGAVQNVQEIMEEDPQIKERGFLVPLKHPVLGAFKHSNPPYILSKTQARIRTAPGVGEHTEYVCTEFLGMSGEEFKELEKSGIFK
jgi:benzylsuccinate CoA-transferase BbsF subunit